MASNLIALLERLLGSGDVLARLGALIGASPEKTKSAIGAAVPGLLASLVGVAQNPEGRTRLAAQVQNQDPGLLDNLASTLTGGGETSLINSGSRALSSLFGQDKVEGLTGAISGFTGLDRNSTGPLLGALAPVVMGVLGREQRAQGLDAQGLARMLGDQKEQIAAALPSGLAGALGATGLLDGVAERLGQGAGRAAQAGQAAVAGADRAADAATSHASGAVAAARRSSGSPLRWVIAAVAALAVLWIGYQFLFRGDQMQEAADKAVDTATQVGESAKNLTVGDVDVGQEVTGWFDGVTKTLGDVTDAASAEAALPKLNDFGSSLDKISGLAEQLPAEGKSTLVALVSAALPNLEALVAKVSEIPGAGDVIGPVADAMLEKLRAMTA
jgi:hypothetical protein